LTHSLFASVVSSREKKGGGKGGTSIPCEEIRGKKKKRKRRSVLELRFASKVSLGRGKRKKRGRRTGRHLKLELHEKETETFLSPYLCLRGGRGEGGKKSVSGQRKRGEVTRRRGQLRRWDRSRNRGRKGEKKRGGGAEIHVVRSSREKKKEDAGRKERFV